MQQRVDEVSKIYSVNSLILHCASIHDSFEVAHLLISLKSIYNGTIKWVHSNNEKGTTHFKKQRRSNKCRYLWLHLNLNLFKFNWATKLLSLSSSHCLCFKILDREHD